MQTLKSDKVEYRFAAAYVIGEKKVPLPKTLIQTLTDKNLDVQQVARRSLILLACYATMKQPDETTAGQKAAEREIEKQVKSLLKLGPPSTTSKQSIANASRKWTEWWDKNDPDLEKLKTANGKPSKGAKTG